MPDNNPPEDRQNAGGKGKWVKKWWDLPVKVSLPLVFFIISAWGINYTTGWFTSLETHSIVAMWFVGAAFIGFLSGFTSGASTQSGTATEFLKFTSSGLIVPLTGALTGFLKNPEKTSETSRYENGVLVQKVTETSSDIPEGFHPLVILGGFFCFYAAFAVLGIVAGIVCKKKQFVIDVIGKWGKA